MTKDEFRCPVCDTTGQWDNVDNFRLKPQGMHICKSCGFVTYPEKHKTEEEIKEYYRKDYRTLPQAHNIVTGMRKLNFHHFFLNPIFEEWKKIGHVKPVIGEIGSALGMFLDWAKKHFPEGDFHGTELTTSYRKVAKHYYGLDLVEDFDFTKQYDLIVSYHVLEHQLDPDQKLKEYAQCLKPHGFFYLSCPVWFRDLSISAKGSYEIEEYFHPDHINSWDERHLEYIIDKAGLEVVYKNNDIYGNTYILKKKTSDEVKHVPNLFTDCLAFLDKALRVQECLLENKTKDALSIYQNCPVIWANHYEFNRAYYDKHQDELTKFISDCIEACPNSGDALILAGEVMTRYERYDEALEYLEKALKKKPNASTILFNMSNCYRGLAMKEIDVQKKDEYLNRSIHILKFVQDNAQEMRERCQTWMFHDMAMLST